MTLKLSSDRIFYSIQGEGSTVGVPAVFLRVAHCTLDCAWCDTKEVWKNSTTFTFKDALALLKASRGLEAINNGAHLVLTGGSPLLQQEQLAGFLGYILFATEKNRFDWFVEVETEGVLMPRELASFVAQWNVSPKLANSGMPYAKRIKPDVLQWHNEQSSIFKFPVSEERDLDEVDKLVNDLKLFRKKVYLMPVASTKAELDVRSPQVIEWAKQRYYAFSTRLHLSVWDQATGV